MLEVFEPVFSKGLPVLLIVVSGISNESSSDKDVANNSVNLGVKRLAALFPTLTLGRQAVEQTNTTVNLELDSRHLALDGLGLADQGCVLCLVSRDTVLEVLNEDLSLLGTVLRLLKLRS
jgi:hypothetical protein